MADAALTLPALPSPLADAATGILLGLSGGLDSMVLLHLLASAPRREHRPLRALHVHHGLDPAADDWAALCQDACNALSVPLEIARVEVPRDRGLGREGAARAARHAVFASSLRANEILALAHHQDDQAETFLLRALRASGPDGLAAMQAWRAHAGGWLWRPLLDCPRAALLDFARRQGLRWIEDPSNADTALDRNFLRVQVLPLLRERWPHAAAAFARSAALCAEASTLLREDDERALAGLRGGDDRVVDAQGLQVLPRERRARVLRHWIEMLGLPPLPANGVERVEADLLHAAPDADAAFAWSGARLRRWRQWLHAGPVVEALPEDWESGWDGAGDLPLPGGGALRLEGAAGFAAPVRVHARRGGERIRLPGRAHHHALKHVLQDHGVPPWVRERLPLLSSGDGELLAAGDLVVGATMADWLAGRGARLRWWPGPAVAALSTRNR